MSGMEFAEAAAIIVVPAVLAMLLLRLLDHQWEREPRKERPRLDRWL